MGGVARFDFMPRCFFGWFSSLDREREAMVTLHQPVQHGVGHGLVANQ